MRHVIKIVGLAALLSAAFLPAGRAADGAVNIELKSKTVVEGGTILLGDVALLPDSIAKDVRDLPLGNAPTPGHDRQISRMLVKVRMISSGCDMSRYTFAGSDVCKVEVESASITAAQIVETARKHLASYFPAGSADVEITLAGDEVLRDTPDMQLPVGANPPVLRATLPQGSPSAGKVRVDVEIVQGNVVLRKVPVSFMLKIYQDVVVAQKAIPAGQKLTGENVALSRRELSAVRGTYADSLDDALGKVTAVAIQPAQIISNTMVHEPEAPVVIEANQNVFLVVQTETLRVVTLGKSLARARRGEVARARNLVTGREVLGVAGDDATIHVLLGGPSNGQ